MLTVRTSPELLEHLKSFEQDGGTVESILFEGGRLSYPGRKEIEYQLGYTEPYTLELEARVLEGLTPKMTAAIRMLSEHAFLYAEKLDQTLELLWAAHGKWARKAISLDRLVAALVAVELLKDSELNSTMDKILAEATLVLVKGLHEMGFPPTQEGLEELFDGAPPACVGLQLVDL